MNTRRALPSKHIGNASTSKAWTEHCNDLIYRLTKLYPKNFVGVAQLPQSRQANRGVNEEACLFMRSGGSHFL